MAESDGREESQKARIFRQNTKRLRQKLLDKYLMSMKEDLVEWLSSAMDVEDLNARNFMSKLDNGVLLCQHARIMQNHAKSYVTSRKFAENLVIPEREVVFRRNGAFHGSFIARDNVSNFIAWCRDLGIPKVVVFETEDLVLHKNEKAVILTLLELAKKGAMFGMKPVRIIDLEKEIERELEAERQKEELNQEGAMAREDSDTFEKEIILLENESLTCEKEDPEFEKENSMLENENVLLEKESLPSKKESLPIKTESGPIEKEIPLTKEESLPIKTESLPSNTESLPIKTESLPIKKESLPIKKDSLPIKTESLPSKTESLPSKTESLPFKKGSLPIKTQSLPSRKGCLPVKTRSLPIEQETTPVKKESLPNERESLPVKTESLSTEQESLPDKTESFPIELETIPMKKESLPIEQESLPDKTESLPIEQDTPPIKTESFPNEQDSLPVKKDSLPIEKDKPEIKSESPPIKIEVVPIQKDSPSLQKESRLRSRKRSPKPKKEILPVEKEYDLDELVQQVVNACTCATKFPVKKLGDGRYTFGKSKQIFFVRVMRNHVMVRVGGGWNELEHFIYKHDPCRLLVGGYIDYMGEAQKLDSPTASAIMDFCSDGASACSSESRYSLDGSHLSSLSPDPDDGKPYCSFGPSVSRQSSMVEDSDDEANYVRGSKSEPINFGKPNGSDTKDYLCQSKSDTFTKFGARQISLLSENLTDTDVYGTRNPNDSWLRNLLNKRKEASKVMEGGECVHKGEQLVDGKENKIEENSSEKLTVDSIKKKYGKPVKSQRAGRKGSDMSSSAQKRTVTSPVPKIIAADGEDVPSMQARGHSHYQSWDQSFSGIKRRREGLLGTRERSDLARKGKAGSRESLQLTPSSHYTFQRRPSFSKGYTVDSVFLKRSGIRRRGEETPPQSPEVRREVSADCISRRRPSRLPLPTFRKTGSRSNSISRGSSNQSLFGGPLPHMRNPISRSATNDFKTSPRNGSR